MFVNMHSFMIVCIGFSFTPFKIFFYCMCFLNKSLERKFPAGPMARILHSQCRGPGFDPW